MLAKQILRCIVAIAALLLSSLSARAQRGRGELRLEVRDAQGAAIAPTAEDRKSVV